MKNRFFILIFALLSSNFSIAQTVDQNLIPKDFVVKFTSAESHRNPQAYSDNLLNDAQFIEDLLVGDKKSGEINCYAYKKGQIIYSPAPGLDPTGGDVYKQSSHFDFTRPGTCELAESLLLHKHSLTITLGVSQEDPTHLVVKSLK